MSPNRWSYQCSVCGEVPVNGFCPHGCEESLCGDCAQNEAYAEERRGYTLEQLAPCDRCGNK